MNEQRILLQKLGNKLIKKQIKCIDYIWPNGKIVLQMLQKI